MWNLQISYRQLLNAINELADRVHNRKSKWECMISSLRLTAPSSSSFDYEEEFKPFQKTEIKLWRDRDIERFKKEPILYLFLKTSLLFFLAHWFHSSSFTTITVRNGSTADPSNPCTAIVMANGFDDKPIIMDHVIRREVRDPFIYYSEDILACREQHLFMACNRMLASVEVV